jgi:hypothetical protein
VAAIRLLHCGRKERAADFRRPAELRREACVETLKRSGYRPVALVLSLQSEVAMAARESVAQKKTIERVMHEAKHGELKTGQGKKKVTSRKQAIAIALHEAGASRNESPAKNRKNLTRTKRKEARGETYQDEAEGRGAAARR